LEEGVVGPGWGTGVNRCDLFQQEVLVVDAGSAFEDGVLEAFFVLVATRAGIRFVLNQEQWAAR